MASYRLRRPDLFPEGTSIGIYPAQAMKVGQAPTGSAVATAEHGASEAVFHGLEESEAYVAYAGSGGTHRYVSFVAVPNFRDSAADRGRIAALEELVALRTTFSVEEFLDDNGDMSYAAAAASWAVKNLGGGYVTFGDGEWQVQGVPWFQGVFYLANGPGATILQPVDSDDPTPMFVAQATDEVLATERFTHGGFLNLEIDGLDEDGACVAISTFDLQTVPAEDEAIGLYTWLQHVRFEMLYIHDCAKGIDLWGDCRYLPFDAVRIWNCAVGMYVYGNHPNLRNVEFRFCEIGLDCTQILDVELIGCKFNQCAYGIGGPAGRTDRFGSVMGRVARTRIIGCQFFQASVRALALDIQNEVIGCLFYGDDASGFQVEINGGSNRLADNWFFQMNAETAIQLANGSSGLQETIHCAIEHNRFSITGGGRAIEWVSGTDDTQGFRLHGNNFSISSVPADGLGGVVLLVPVTVGQLEHAHYSDNYIWTSILQPDHMVKVLSTATRGYLHTANQYIATHAVGTSKGFSCADSRDAMNAINRFSKCGATTDALSLGTTNAATVSTPNVIV